MGEKTLIKTAVSLQLFFYICFLCSLIYLLKKANPTHCRV